jgi:hypothetical protein
MLITHTIQYAVTKCPTIGDLRKGRASGWLAEADIYVDGWFGVDTSLRRLRRVFNNGSFEEGGASMTAFWMGIANGEPPAELDYGQIALRLLYARVGVQPVPAEALARNVVKVVPQRTSGRRGCPRECGITLRHT